MRTRNRQPGLREGERLPEELSSRTTEEIIRLAFHAIEPEVFPAPSWLLGVEAIDGTDADHAELICARHLDAVTALGSDRLKHEYLQGVLDAGFMMEMDRKGFAGVE